jgi:hypothetical protein
MNRTYQMMSVGAGANALGAIALIDSQDAQRNSREFPISIAMAGPTGARPQVGDPDIPLGPVQGGVLFLDLTLGYIVVSDGAGGWRNPASGSVV